MKQTQDVLRPRQLAFIGKVMAGVSHEFKNHLAIIRELNGLMEDILAAGDAKGKADPARLRKIFGGIEDRIEQAAEMCRFLSGFSHRMDESLSFFHVNDLLREELHLLQRFAKNSMIRLESFPGENIPAIYNDPALLQFAVFCIVQPLLDQTEKNGGILLTTSSESSDVVITISREGVKKEPPGNNESTCHVPLLEALERLKADLVRPSAFGDREEFILTVPSIK